MISSEGSKINLQEHKRKDNKITKENDDLQANIIFLKFDCVNVMCKHIVYA